MQVARACRVQEHTLLPNETVYTHAYFPLELDEDLYIAGFYTDVVNAVHMHHFLAYLCTETFDQLYRTPREAGFPEQPVNEEANGTITAWSAAVLMFGPCVLASGVSFWRNWMASGESSPYFFTTEKLK